jgi:hypothetical protein
MLLDRCLGVWSKLYKKQRFRGTSGPALRIHVTEGGLLWYHFPRVVRCHVVWVLAVPGADRIAIEAKVYAENHGRSIRQAQLIFNAVAKESANR